MKNILKILLMTGVVAATFWLGSGTASAANDPFTCSSNFYQVLNGQLMLLNPSTGAYSNIGSNAGFQYNGIGYNVEDNYIYGMDYIGGTVGNLVKIGSDGTVTDLGLPTGLPVGAYYNGSFDLAGNLYVMTDVDAIYKIDVSAMTATLLTITGDDVVGADSAFIDNKLYFLDDTSLTIVDLNTNIANTVTVTGPGGWNASNFFGAAWANQDGELFYANNGSGSIFQIMDFDTVSPTAVFKVAGATVVASNDGTNCVTAAQNPFDPPEAHNDSYTTAFNTPLSVTITPTLSNDLGNSITVTSNTNPAHGTLSLNGDGTFTYTPNAGYSGTDSFNYTITDNFGRTASATVTITISASVLQAPAAGYGMPPRSNSLTMQIIGAAFISLGIGVGLLYRQSRPKRYKLLV